ncbi:MAG: hypothetical protein JRJ84_23820, partial [Deltaproteobacteria bacterium]|nr:hypothetical protein [Deltaproteobacteria bacterium]
GVTLTLQNNQDMCSYDNYPYGGNAECVSFAVDEDVFNEGTITTDAPFKFLELDCVSFHGAAGSKIDLDGDSGAEGGQLNVWGWSIYNQGAITAVGANGVSTDGRRGGYLELYASYGLYNTGAITLRGGNSDDGHGGYGGEGRLESNRGVVFNSGLIDLRGGNGTDSGGLGGRFRLDADDWGSVRNSGDIDASGGNAVGTCVDEGGCEGGDARHPNHGSEAVRFTAEGGVVINSGDITADGGAGNGSYGGEGGHINFRSYDGDGPAGSILISGNLSARGGAGTDGGEGGRVESRVQAEGLTPAEIVYYGYGGTTGNGNVGIVLNGGDSTDGYGGDGGEAIISNDCTDRHAVPTGGAVNFADIAANGGDTTTGEQGGYGGYVEVRACQYNDDHGQQLGGAMAINAGDLELTGGDSGPDDWGRSGGDLYMRAWDWAENRGTVDASAGRGGEGGGTGGSVSIRARNGPAVNSGDLTLPGSDVTDDGGEGGDGGYFRLRGTLADNGGDIDVPGGDGGTTNGYGGEGGSIVLFSLDGTSVNTGTFDIDPGTGADGNDGEGTVVIDGNNETGSW